MIVTEPGNLALSWMGCALSPHKLLGQETGGLVLLDNHHYHHECHHKIRLSCINTKGNPNYIESLTLIDIIKASEMLVAYLIFVPFFTLANSKA